MAAVKRPEDFKCPDAYVTEQCEYIDEVAGTAILLRHKKSGARVLAVSNNDDNKVFSIGFRTPPSDDTGTQHIIEHTVLCGSKNFPVKDPFIELVKGSLNTYLNATTYPDKTLYPAASTNDKDFKNLMHVYMDAVFFPDIYRYKEIFMQEGWHYELEDPDSPLKINGVVYNEMKGAYSSDDTVTENILLKAMFPDTCYCHDSGGDPEIIPELTREKYLDYHRKFYHPSNSYIYIYGDMDIEERLRWMDENYLSGFDRTEVDSEIKDQEVFSVPVWKDGVYAVAEGDDTDSKTEYAFAVMLDITLDRVKCKAFDVLSYILVDMPGAPVKKALTDAGMGNDITVDVTDYIKQGYFAIYVKNAPSGRKQEIRDIILGIIKDLCSRGIDKKVLEAALNSIEFKDREADFGSFPRGLVYGMRVMNTWLYDDSRAFDTLKYGRIYEELHNDISGSYFEDLLKKYVLENTHQVIVEMNPEPGLNTKIEKRTAEKLARIKENMSPDEIQKLADDTKKLKEFQTRPDDAKDLEKIPVLSRSDIRKEIRPVNFRESDIKGIPAVYSNVNSNGIVYMKLAYDITDLKNYVSDISIFTDLLGELGTGRYTYPELDTQLNMYTGGMRVSVTQYKVWGSENDWRVNIEVNVKLLEKYAVKASDIVQDILFNTDFSDLSRIKEVIGEERSHMRMYVTSAGNAAASLRAKSYLYEDGMVSDSISGLGYYERLCEIDDDPDTQIKELASRCMIFMKIFKDRKRLTMFCGSDEDGCAAFKNAMEKSVLISSLSDQKENSLKNDLGTRGFKDMTPVIRNEGITTSSKVQYVACAGNFDISRNVGAGVLIVVRHILNFEYLWSRVRVLGGAYGISCSFSRDGRGSFASYRDPQCRSTYEAYKEAVDFLKEYDPDDREMDKAVIGTISDLDTPFTPSMEASRNFAFYQTKLPSEVLQNERDEVLGCTREDVQKAAEAVREVTESGCICVVGSEDAIKKDRDLFGEVHGLK